MSSFSGEEESQKSACFGSNSCLDPQILLTTKKELARAL